MDDAEAWSRWPQHRLWFNKLHLADRLGYACGPTGVVPPKDGFYIVRPIYNLSGMGVGARRQWLTTTDYGQVEPGFFWCEWFDGPQCSVTYSWHNGWVPISSWEGRVSPDNLSRFHSWKRSDHAPTPPPIMDELAEVDVINIEWIGAHVIEVHLRPSPDPDEGSEIVPVWEGDEVPTEGFIPSFDDADGFLPVPRLGFIVLDR